MFLMMAASNQPHWNLYFSVTKIGDLALLKLEKTPIQGRIDTENYPFEEIPLIPSDLNTSGKYCKISGWGRTTHGGKKPHILQSVDLLVPSSEICAQMLKNLPWDGKNNTMICAGKPIFFHIRTTCLNLLNISESFESFASLLKLLESFFQLE